MDPAAHRVALVWDARLLLHLAHTREDEWSPEHQREHPGRLAAVLAALEREGCLAHPRVLAVPRCEPASAEQLRAVHGAAHLERLARLDTRRACSAPPLDGPRAETLLRGGAAALAAAGNVAPGYGTVPARSVFHCDDTPAVAALAAGCVLAAVDACARGAARAALALVRPPGHHCSAHEEAGFCWVNNVAVAARHAQAVRALRRVAILDWDVHHGDGTQAIVAGDPSVLLVSVHRHMPARGFGFYPGTGAADDVGCGPGTAPAAGGGRVVNIALPYFGLGDVEYAVVMEQLVLPLLREWGPDLLLVSCGLDAAHGDPLGGMHVTPHGFRHMARLLAASAPPGCGVVLALEGGYDLPSLAACSLGVLGGLLAETEAASSSSSSSSGGGGCGGGGPGDSAGSAGLGSGRVAPVPYAHPAVLQCLRNVAAAHASAFACMRELHAHADRGLLLGPAAAFSPLVDHAFDHQRVRRRAERARVPHVAARGQRWALIDFRRSAFPAPFAYTDSPFDEPVQDAHLYALLAPPEQVAAAQVPVAACTTASVLLEGAFWKPFGPCQLWVQAERLFETRALAVAALEAVSIGAPPPATLRNGGGGSTDGTCDGGGDASHVLVLSDMLGRVLLRLPLLPAPPAGRASSERPPLRGWQATLHGALEDPHGARLFSRPQAGAPAGDWLLLDGAEVDVGCESRVLVAPGCAEAYARFQATAIAATAAPATGDPAASPDQQAKTGFVPNLPCLARRSDEIAGALRSSWRSGGSDADAPPLVPAWFSPDDFQCLALRVYLGDERDDDKDEKAQWVGQGPADALTALLQQHSIEPRFER